MKAFSRTRFIWLSMAVLATSIAQPAFALQNNVALEDLSGAKRSRVFHTIEVPENASNLTISMSGGTGDADLYVRYRHPPTTSKFNCRPFMNGNNEECVIDITEGGTYQIMVRAYAAFSGMTLVASYSEDTLEETTVPATNVCMNPVEQQLLDAHNQARAQARSCANDSFAAAQPLEWSCPLHEAATSHSVDMGFNNFFSHTGSDGLSAGNRITNNGYVWQTWGENIAAGYPDIDSVMQGWLNSPGHCRAIMNPNFTQMGSARVDIEESTYVTYWATVFATPR